MLAVTLQYLREGQQKASMRTMQPHAELLDPFRVHLLQHLPVGSLVQLRSTCQAFRALVDSGMIYPGHSVAKSGFVTKISDPHNSSAMREVPIAPALSYPNAVDLADWQF